MGPMSVYPDVACGEPRAMCLGWSTRMSDVENPGPWARGRSTQMIDD